MAAVAGVEHSDKDRRILRISEGASRLVIFYWRADARFYYQPPYGLIGSRAIGRVTEDHRSKKHLDRRRLWGIAIGVWQGLGTKCSRDLGG